jgi:ubiquinone/menaquinone biosynthesis C-methylase UbiE
MDLKAMTSASNWHHDATAYSKLEITGTGYLAFKYIPALLEKHQCGNKALDYGCGAGRSTRFLKNLGLDVEGVDVSSEMIAAAVNADDNIPYMVINSAEIPKKDNTYDLVFCSLVLFDISTHNELEKVFNEVHRVLKNGGLFIIITASEHMYVNDWVSLKTDFPENKNLTSGALAKIKIREIDLTLYDYYWTDSDYKDLISDTNFSLVDFLNPLGGEDDGYEWISEKTLSPYGIYVLKK